MATQRQERRPNSSHERSRKQYHKTRWLIASIALVCTAAGAGIWILTNQSAFTTILPILIFSILGVLISLFQWLFPLSSTASEHLPALPSASPVPLNASVAHPIPSIIIHLPPDQPLSEPALLPNTSSYRRIVGLPPLNDSRTIQQRDQVVKAIYSKLTQSKITAICLTGIGGAGKSTLAALLCRYTEEQRAMNTSPFLFETLWLTVDSTVTFADLVGNLFDALGKPIPDLSNLAPQNQAVTLFNALNTADKPRLIIFDQFENLLNWDTGHALADRPGVGEWIDIINSQPCACRILLTSRPCPVGTREYPPTHLQEFPVEGLEVAEGIALLRNRGVTGTEDELETAVMRCEGHAFSLSLLASLIHDHTISMTSLLKDPILWIGNIASNFLDYIYSKQLNQTQRQLLLAFSVYREPVLLEATEAILTDVSRSQVADALKTLRVQHLIAPTGEGHYQLHTIIAEYAHRHFDESGDQANELALRASHLRAARYYLQQAGIYSLPERERRNMSNIHDLVEAIWHHCQAEQWQEAYRLIEQEQIFSSLKQWGGNAILLELCLLLQPRDSWSPEPSQSATIYRYMAWAYNALGKVELAIKYFEQALLLYRASEDLEGQAKILDYLGWSYQRSGQAARAITFYEQALGICKDSGDRRGKGRVLNGLGRVYAVLGQREQALKYFEQALALSKEVGDPKLEGRTLSNLGLIHTDLGNNLKALEYLEQSLAIRKLEGDRRGEAVVIDNLGRVYNEMGQSERAAKYFEEALSMDRTIGDRGLEGWSLHNLGWICNMLGQYEHARVYLEQALYIHQEVGNRRGECRTIRDLGKSSRMLGQKEQALKYYKRALNISEEIRDPFGKATTLQNAAFVFADQTKYDLALACLLVTRRIFDDLHSPSYSDNTRKSIDTIQKEIGEEQFAPLFALVEPQAHQIVNQALMTGNEISA